MLFPNKEVKVCGGVETDTGSQQQSVYGRLRCPILGHRYAPFAHLTGREGPPTPTDIQDALLNPLEMSQTGLHQPRQR